MMKYTQTENSAFPLITISLDQNEKVQIENGAMVYHNGKIHLEGVKNSNGHSGLGGVMRALGRSAVSGESFFITFATGLERGAQVAIAPSTPGRILELPVGQTQWRLNTSAFLACDASVSYNMIKQNLSGALFGGTGGLYVMETQGEGSVLVNAFGDIQEITLDGSHPIVIDNQHVIAWENQLDYNIRVASGSFGFKTGEGLVNEFHGTGKIYIQTRNLQSLAADLGKYISSN